MTQWTDSTSIWTTRSSDEWLGDGGVSPASPIPVTATVQDHFAGTLSNVYQDTLLSVSTNFHVASVEVSTTIRAAEALNISVAQVATDLVIDTACHVSTLSLGTVLHAHEGQRVSIAYQAVKPHAQITPKNPIVESDVLLNADALDISGVMVGNVYAGYYTEIEAKTLAAQTFMYPGGVVASTNIEVPSAFSLGLSETLSNLVVDVSPVVLADMADEMRTRLLSPTIESTCIAGVDAIPLDLSFPGFEFVATGYAAQDDLPIRFTLNQADVWNDYEAVARAALRVDAVSHEVSTAYTVTIPAQTSSMEVLAGAHALTILTYLNVPGPMGAMSLNLNTATQSFDFEIPCTSNAASLSVGSHVAEFSCVVNAAPLAAAAVTSEPEYSCSSTVDVETSAVASAIVDASVFYDYLLPVLAQGVSFAPLDAAPSTDSHHYLGPFGMQLSVLRPDYSGPRVTEFALMETKVRKEVVIETPVNAYSTVSEVEA